ncbi:H-2 class II histocompatibility antigen, E-S beta chain-like [Leuresthes tenuis]|uniref:H-2 class II histocompatibility antigen, E-S beta chain-like n=1 Tax=Leuresthes tenuis TaxID=355514 RepID=UPI003B508EDD
MLTLQSFLSLLFLLFSSADALFGYGLLRCQFTSDNDLLYLEQLYFNKILLVQFNGTLGKYTGYTKKAMEIADQLNKSERFLKQEKKNEEKCRTHQHLAFGLLSKPVEPSVRLMPVELQGSRHQSVLVCSAYDFYPKPIKLSWLRNGKEVTTDVTSTEELPDGNWLYQAHSHLEFTPTSGEKITCKVEHASLKEPKLYDWEPMPSTQWKKVIIGTIVLLLGLVSFFAGLALYKKNSAGKKIKNQPESESLGHRC